MFSFINKILASWKQFKANLTEKNRHIGKIVETIETLTLALIVALFLREFVVQSSLVYSGSMIPTLKYNGGNQFLKSDRLIVNKLVQF